MPSEEFQAALDRVKNPWYDLDLALPEWFDSFRPPQIKAIEEINAAFKSVEVVLLDAPTGAGKTLIAEVCRQLLQVQGIYCCTQKSLQEQAARDFPWGKVIKGRANYPTEGFPRLFGGRESLSCADCTKEPGLDDSCKWCSSVRLCPYERAKHEALKSPLTIANTSYLLTECNGPGKFRHRGLVVIDEADTLEQELMRYVEFNISSRSRERYALPTPKITVVESWLPWIEETRPILHEKILNLSRDGNPNNLRTLREFRSLVNMREGLSLVRRGLEDGTWVYTGDKEKIQFKPIGAKQSGLAEPYLFRHSSKWLLMTGTPVSPSFLMEEEIGCEREYRVVTIPYSWDISRRPVYFSGVADLSGKEKDPAELEKLRDSVTSIVSATDQKVLIHTVSYNLAGVVCDTLEQRVGKPVFRYRDSSERESILSEFRESSGGIMVAPSMDRGVDLPGELCRIQIIAKIPFPYLGDKQVAKRKYTPRTGNLWYVIQTIRTLIQMTGRAVRSEDDWAETWILDKSFQGLWDQYKHLMPEWWRKGIRWR